MDGRSSECGLEKPEGAFSSCYPPIRSPTKTSCSSSVLNLPRGVCACCVEGWVGVMVCVVFVWDILSWVYYSESILDNREYSMLQFGLGRKG